jgi:hypothetical protein
MTSNRTHPGERPESAEQAFGQTVYDLHLEKYGHPVLSSYQSIQQLKSADWQATVTLLFGTEAASSERFKQIDPKDFSKEIVEQVATMQSIIKVQGKSERKATALSGLLEFLGNTLASLG